jgi:iron(III) transport system permease protein
MGYVISVVLIVASVLAMWLSALALKGRDYATTQRGGGGLARAGDAPARGCARLWRRHPDPGAGAGAASGAAAALLCDDLVVLAAAGRLHDRPLRRVFGESSLYIKNTLIYAAIAGGIDVVLGVAIAYLVLRTKLVGREWLDWMATAALAIPGVVLGIGYLRTFYGITLPDGTPLAALWITIVMALAIRRLPYALRACHAALQQISVSLEEAAENLGATKARTVRRIVVPLMTGGILAGFVTLVRDGGGRALRDLDASAIQFRCAAGLWALRLHAVGRRAGPWRGARRRRGRARRGLHFPVAPHRRTQPEGQGNGPLT